MWLLEIKGEEEEKTHQKELEGEKQGLKGRQESE